jgi:hypothetical protein
MHMGWLDCQFKNLPAFLLAFGFYQFAQVLGYIAG